MLPAPRNYAIWPSVIPADIPSQMTIAPTERAFLLQEGVAYTLGIISIGGDEPDYYSPSGRRMLTATAHDGVLRFEFTFPGEQEHLILLERDGQPLGELNVFSLRDDLYRLLPLKGDLHSHSFRSDGKRDPAALAGHFREQGYDFFALTDHNRYYPGGEIDEVYKGVRTGLTRIPGEEVHAPGSPIHIVHVGGQSSVTELYVHHRENFEREIEEILSAVPSCIPESFRSRYAKVMWAVEKIHAAGGLAIFPHPFWKPGKSRMQNLTNEYAALLLKSGLFDAYELVGCMDQPDNNRSVALWGDLRAEGLRIPTVGSSDAHSLEKSSTFPYHFTLCFAEANDVASITAAVRAGLCVAVEATGTEYDRHYRCYGSLRLVTYAQYLLQHYFPAHQRISQGEGTAMRAYAMGEAPAALVELQADQVENFRLRFFGRKPPQLPTAEILDFENRWRETQLNGPLTKGSVLNAPPITRQI